MLDSVTNDASLRLSQFHRCYKALKYTPLLLTETDNKALSRRIYI